MIADAGGSQARRDEVPALVAIMTAALGPEAANQPDAVLSLALQNDLPVAVVRKQFDVDVDANCAWATALAAEHESGQRRAATLRQVVVALGPLASRVAWCGREWRGGAGTDVDLVVPAAVIDDAYRRLRDGGLLALRRWETENRRVLLRIEQGSVADLVDLELGSAADIDGTATPLGIGRLTTGAAADRLCRRVATHRTVRLVDLAELQALGLDPAVLARSGDALSRRGWAALTAAAVTLASGPSPFPMRLGWRHVGMRGAVTTKLAKVTVRLPPGPRSWRLVVRGDRPAAEMVADRVADSLRRAGLPVDRARGARSTTARAVSAWRAAIRAYARGGVAVLDGPSNARLALPASQLVDLAAAPFDDEEVLRAALFGFAGATDNGRLE